MPLGPKGAVRFLPALVAAVRNDAGILALNRTFLDPDSDRLASFEQPKRSLGSPGSGAVRLAYPRDGRQIGRAPCRDRGGRYVMILVVAVCFKKNKNRQI